MNRLKRMIHNVSYKSRRDNKGFTIVELITVVTILGLLAGILVPTMLGYIDEANLEAEYAAGESCRLAAQAKLDGMAFVGTAPNYNTDGEVVSPSKIEFWHKYFATPVIEMSGQKVYNLFIATGRLDENDLNQAYKVYCVAYQQSEDSTPVFYNGSEWTAEYPWGGVDFSDPTLTINGTVRQLQFYCLKCGGDSPEDVMTAFAGDED